MKMTFKQAKRKLKKIAGGQYHCVRYEITEYEDGQLVQECAVYIAGSEFKTAPTWEEAFMKLNPPKVSKVIIDNIEEIL